LGNRLRGGLDDFLVIQLDSTAEKAAIGIGVKRGESRQHGKKNCKPDVFFHALSFLESEGWP